MRQECSLIFVAANQMLSAGFFMLALPGFLSFAFGHDLRAAGMKSATRRRVFRIGDVAL
jgi:hypothetical protein